MNYMKFGGQAPTRPAGTAYSAPTEPLAGTKGRGGKESKRGVERGRQERRKDRQCLKCVDAPAIYLTVYIRGMLAVHFIIRI